MPLAVLVAGELVSGRRPQPPAPSVALNPIRTRWMEHLGRRPPCLRIMPFRTSCGRPDPAAGVVCGTMTRCFRHCRADHTNGGAFGSSCAPHECVWCVWGNKPVLHIQFRFGMGLWNWRSRRQQAPYARTGWRVRGGQRPATVLRPFVHHADLLIRRLT